MGVPTTVPSSSTRDLAGTPTAGQRMRIRGQNSWEYSHRGPQFLSWPSGFLKKGAQLQSFHLRFPSTCLFVFQCHGRCTIDWTTSYGKPATENRPGHVFSRLEARDRALCWRSKVAATVQVDDSASLGRARRRRRTLDRRISTMGNSPEPRPSAPPFIMVWPRTPRTGALQAPGIV